MGKVSIKYELEDQELWSAMWGSGFESDPVTRNYLMSLDFVEGDWETVGIVKVGYVDPNDDTEGEDETKWLTQSLNIVDLVEALELAIKGYRHVPCGGDITPNLEDWDACISDIILQLALYGKEVWA
jgi:hypothetical protein